MITRREVEHRIAVKIALNMACHIENEYVPTIQVLIYQLEQIKKELKKYGEQKFDENNIPETT